MCQEPWRVVNVAVKERGGGSAVNKGVKGWNEKRAEVKQLNPHV